MLHAHLHSKDVVHASRMIETQARIHPSNELESKICFYHPNAENFAVSLQSLVDDRCCDITKTTKPRTWDSSVAT